MANVSRLVGVALMAVGVGGYVVTGMTSATALIPAAFGIVISMLGFYGRHEDTRRTAMHLSIGIALAGIIGSMSGIAALLAVATGRDASLSSANVSRAVMAVILIAYVAAGLRSFATASRKRH